MLMSYPSIFFLGWIGATPGFIDWTVLSLMKTGIWCFLLTLVSLLTIQDFKHANKFNHYSLMGIFYVFIVLCRPESMLIVPFFALLNIFKAYNQNKSLKIALKWNIYSSFFFVLSLTILILWRIYYFVYPLPNTYYAKVTNNYSENILNGLNYL